MSCFKVKAKSYSVATPTAEASHGKTGNAVLATYSRWVKALSSSVQFGDGSKKIMLGRNSFDNLIQLFSVVCVFYVD